MTNNTKRQTRKAGKTALVASFILFVSVFWSCTNDNYDSGDGTYSYLRAEFAMTHIANDSTIDYAINDDDRRIDIKKSFKPRWTTTTDSLYRALLYYNDKSEGAEAVKLTQVYVLTPVDTSKVEKLVFDPVNFESSWISPNENYLNFSFFVKTGKPDDEDAHHSIGILSDTTDDGTYVFTLYHDQGGVPEYYSTRVYASIPLTDEMRQKNLRLVINTYSGLVIKDYPALTTAH